MAALLISGTTALAPSAIANTSQGVIAGADAVTDDWGDEGPLDYNSYSYSRAVALWQWVLRAEGLYTGAIDCDFGPATTSATKAFQARYGLTQDGSAGPLTMGAVDGYLTMLPDGVTVRYWAPSDYVDFRRVNGTYQVWLNGAWRTASYTSASGC
ncbi:peptidoglycan-binding domain-containing protein [Streptomyces olivaceoviridis]|uniref:peptidoglycan-binding domain-containing protein n=1 Tax=Streptomyces olivaceoviridis TaxID=1921 RepID=UPI0036C6C561